MSPLVLISINLVAIIIFASLLNLSSLEGILFFNIATGLVALLQTISFSIYNIIILKNKEYEATQ
jgi:hypothetical protein